MADENKQLTELSEEELKDVTGGGFSKGEVTCPDGRKVSSVSQCIVTDIVAEIIVPGVAGVE